MKASRLLQKERRIRLTFVIFLLIGVTGLLLFAENLLLSVILAYVSNYLLSPFVNSLERSGMSRTWATTIPFVVIFLLMVTFGRLLVPLVDEQIEGFREDFPNYIEKSMDWVSNIEQRADYYFGDLADLDFKQKVRDSLFAWTRTFAEDIPSILSTSLTTLFLVPFLSFFLLLDGRKVSRQFLSLVPNAYFELFLNLIHVINRQIGDFFRARILEAIIVGAVIGVGLFLIDFPYAIVLALFAAVTNLIPYLGPVIGAVPAAIIMAMDDSGQVGVMIPILVYMIAHTIDAVFIIPVVVAKIVNLHPVLVVISIILGAQLFGVMGMVVCIPLVSALKVTASALYQHLIEFQAE